MKRSTKQKYDDAAVYDDDDAVDIIVIKDVTFSLGC